MKPSCEAGSNRVGKDFKQLYEEKSKELRVTTENLKNYENIMIDVEKCVKDCRQGGQVHSHSTHYNAFGHPCIAAPPALQPYGRGSKSDCCSAVRPECPYAWSAGGAARLFPGR